MQHDLSHYRCLGMRIADLFPGLPARPIRSPRYTLTVQARSHDDAQERAERSMARKLGAPVHVYSTVRLLAAVALALGLWTSPVAATTPESQPAVASSSAPPVVETRYVVIRIDVRADGSTLVHPAESLTAGQVAALTPAPATRPAEPPNVRPITKPSPRPAVSRPIPARPAVAQIDATGETTGYTGQCTATAVSTEKRCKMRAAKGSDRCRFHQRQ